MKIFILGILVNLSFSNSQIILLIDEITRLPIEDVNVFTHSDGITTDINGLCDVDIFKKNDTITFSAIGYETLKINFNDIPQVIQLKKESLKLELVKVFGKRKYSKKDIED